MCGRATLTAGPAELRELLEVDDVPEMPPRWNLAPSQLMLAMRALRQPELMVWGPKFINSRIETATTKQANRCLVIVDGFYEWRNGDRQPFLFRRRDCKPFAIGGVTRSAASACALVTCPAADGMADLHDRQPLVLTREDWPRWLAGEKLQAVLDDITRHPVSRIVNSPRNDVPQCIEPVEDLPPAQGRLPGFG